MRSLTHLKQRAISLRLEGYSYNIIKRKLEIKSKGTLSYWFKDLSLPEESKRKLEKNIKLANDRGLFRFNRQRTEKIIKENRVAFQEGITKVQDLSPKDLFLIGVSLYWGEGTKSENNRGNLRLAFSNSDPDMIKVFLRFLREILEVKEEKIRAGIHIYSSINPDEARRFWSGVTKLPVSRFYIVNQVSGASRGKRAFNQLPYGTAVIIVNDRKLFFKVKGMIRGIIYQAI